MQNEQIVYTVSVKNSGSFFGFVYISASCEFLMNQVWKSFSYDWNTVRICAYFCTFLNPAVHSYINLYIFKLLSICCFYLKIWLQERFDIYSCRCPLSRKAVYTELGHNKINPVLLLTWNRIPFTFSPPVCLQTLRTGWLTNYDN